MTNNYNVGYKRPPQETRFKKGQSGNPKGRPKGSINFLTLLNKVVNTPITLTDQNGRQIKITKKEAALLQAINKAAKGDLTALKLLLQPMLEAEKDAAENKKRSQELSENDQFILTEFIVRNSLTKGEQND